MRMVTVHRRTPWRLLLVDVLGGGAVAGCIAAIVWLMVIRHDQVSSEITTLRRALETSRENLTTARTVLTRQQVMLRKNENILAKRGKIPDQAPVEEYLQTVSHLARNNQVSVLSQTPMPTQEYPGLHEEHFLYEVSGTMPALTRFLHDMEQADSWVDVGYLTMKRAAVFREDSPVCVAKLTLCVFSAAQSTASPSGEKR